MFRDDLESFLALAEELKLKGLMGQTDAKEDQFQESNASSEAKDRASLTILKELAQITSF